MATPGESSQPSAGGAPPSTSGEPAPALDSPEASEADLDDGFPVGLSLGDTPYTRALWEWVQTLEDPLGFQAWKIATAPIRDQRLEGTSAGRNWQASESDAWIKMLTARFGPKFQDMIPPPEPPRVFGMFAPELAGSPLGTLDEANQAGAPDGSRFQPGQAGAPAGGGLRLAAGGIGVSHAPSQAGAPAGSRFESHGPSQAGAPAGGRFEPSQAGAPAGGGIWSTMAGAPGGSRDGVSQASAPASGGGFSSQAGPPAGNVGAIPLPDLSPTPQQMGSSGTGAGTSSLNVPRFTSSPPRQGSFQQPYGPPPVPIIDPVGLETLTAASEYGAETEAMFGEWAFAGPEGLGESTEAYLGQLIARSLASGHSA